MNDEILDNESCYSCHYLCWCPHEKVYICSKYSDLTGSPEVACCEWKPMKHKTVTKTCYSTTDCTHNLTWCYGYSDNVMKYDTFRECIHIIGYSNKGDKMSIIFQPRIVGNGPYKYSRWIEKRIKKMCTEIVRAKMVVDTDETEEGLFCRLEGKYGHRIFSDLYIHIDRGSVRYDAANMTWYGVFRVISGGD